MVSAFEKEREAFYQTNRPQDGHDTRLRLRRKRRVPAQPYQYAEAANARNRFANAAQSDAFFAVAVPFDWVFGTVLELHVGLVNRQTAGSPVARMESSIHIYPDFNTATAIYNLETSVAVNVTLTQNVLTEWVRTVDPAVFPAGMSHDAVLFWDVTRQGAHASDTVNDYIEAFGGAWLEYYGVYDYDNKLSE